MSYTNLLYHIVYATKSRAPLITSDLKSRLHGYLGGIVGGLGGVPIEINGMSEHVHLLVRIRPIDLGVRFPEQVEICVLLCGPKGKLRGVSRGKQNMGPSLLVNRKLGESGNTFASRRNIIERCPSKKNSKRC